MWKNLKELHISRSRFRFRFSYRKYLEHQKLDLNLDLDLDFYFKEAWTNAIRSDEEGPGESAASLAF